MKYTNDELQQLAALIRPWLTKGPPRIEIPPATSSSNATGSSASATALAALTTLINSHIGQDFVGGHDTSVPAINMHKEYYSKDFGVLGDGVTDDSNAIQNMWTTIGLAGGGRVVMNSLTPTGSIYYNKTISCYYDNMDIQWRSPMISGATGCIRIMGTYDEFTRKADATAMKLHVNSTTNASNQTVLELSATDTALMDAEPVVANRIVVVGDKLSVRGLNDVTGKSIQKDTTFVLSLAKVGAYWQITCTDELDYTFQPHYTTGDSPISSSDWPADATTGTTIYIVRYATFNADLPAGSWFVAVNSIAGFSVGDVIQVGDGRTENDVNSSALKGGGGGPYKNPAALELMRIVGFNIGTGDLVTDNKIYFDRATTRAYVKAAPAYGGCARILPVRNSHFSGARITYNALQTSTSYNSLQMTYAVECSVHDCRVEGLVVQFISGVQSPLYGRAAHACRMSYALNCKAYNNTILDCADSTSGRGYGITDYYSSGNQIYDNIISGCRHNILLQLATNSIIYGNESRNHLISGIDAHGVNSFGCHIFGNTITQANGSTTDSAIAAGIRIGNTSHSNGDHNMTVENNVFVWNNGAADIAFDFIPASSDIVFRNNTVWYAGIGVKFTLNSLQVTPVQTATNITIEGNRFLGCSDRPFKIQAQPTYDGVNSLGKIDKLTIVNNIDHTNNRHIEVVGVAGITNVLIANNSIVNNVSTAGRFGIIVSDVVGLMVRDNNVTGCNKGLSLTNCTGPARVIQNTILGLIDGTTGQFSYVDGGGNTGVDFRLNQTDLGVGIGTGAPVGPLHVAGAVYSTGATGCYVLYDRATNAISSTFYSPNPQQFRIFDHVANVDRISIDSNGLTSVLGRLGNAWTALAYTNSGGTTWADFGGGYEAGQYKVLGDIVFVRGLVARTAGTGTTVAILPVGYRPLTRHVFPADTNTGYGRIDIDTSGNVIAVSGGVGNVSLNFTFSVL